MRLALVCLVYGLMLSEVKNEEGVLTRSYEGIRSGREDIIMTAQRELPFDEV